MTSRNLSSWQIKSKVRAHIAYVHIVQLYAMHILVVNPVQACLWLHDCMLCIILQALNMLGQLRQGFCTIVLHLMMFSNLAGKTYYRVHGFIPGSLVKQLQPYLLLHIGCTCVYTQLNDSSRLFKTILYLELSNSTVAL